jgi:hypothetical protein
LQSSLKDSSEEVICLRKGKDILESDTPIVDLFNTRAEALEIIIIGENGMCKIIASEYFEIYTYISDVFIHLLSLDDGSLHEEEGEESKNAWL